MVVKKIITVPNPILRKKSKLIVKGDKKLKALVKDLKDTLKASTDPKGVGLSAPQLGVLKQALVIKGEKKIKAFINPKIVSSSKKTLADLLPSDKRYFEGCLSVPEIWGFVNRPAKVKIVYQTEKGKEKKEEFEMQKAVFIQHEIDHLNGILFIDRILTQGGKLYRLEKDKKGKNIFIELKIEWTKI